MDPDHPLAALVRKARQERNGSVATESATDEVVDQSASSAPAQYAADRKLRLCLHLYSPVIFPHGALLTGASDFSFLCSD